MDVWEKLETNAYRNPDPMPQKPRKPMLTFATVESSTQVREYADRLDEYEILMKSHREVMASYNARSAALEAEFRHDLEVYFGMVGHPKADLLYHKAYERGHSGGMQEVANHYSDLVDLVK